jgi:hypothetical protein
MEAGTDGVSGRFRTDEIEERTCHAGIGGFRVLELLRRSSRPIADPTRLVRHS